MATETIVPIPSGIAIGSGSGAAGIPAGGATGEFLEKLSSSDYAVGWDTGGPYSPAARAVVVDVVLSPSGGDDTANIKAALTDGVVALKPGTWTIAQPDQIALTVPGQGLVGMGPRRFVVVNVNGNGTRAILVNGTQDFLLGGFKLVKTGGTCGHGVTLSDVALATTSAIRSRVFDLDAFNFTTGHGVEFFNIEQVDFDNVWCEGNLVGLYSADNGGGAGHSFGLYFRRLRLAVNLSKGADLNFIGASMFDVCEAFGNGTGAAGDIQFHARGTTEGLMFNAIDVENFTNASAGYGLVVSGSGHQIHIGTAFDLDRGWVLDSAAQCLVTGGRCASVNAFGEIFPGSLNNEIHNPTGFQAVDNSGNVTNKIFAQGWNKGPRSATGNRVAAATAGAGATAFDTTAKVGSDTRPIGPIWSDGTRWFAPATRRNPSAPAAALYETYSRGQRTDNSGLLVAQRLCVSLIDLPAGFPLNSITFRAGSTGFTAGATSNDQWFCLLDNNLNTLGVTADDAATVWTGLNAKTLYVSRTVTDAAIASGTATLTSATAAFTAADVGKHVTVMGAGAAGIPLGTSATGVTILSVESATSCTLSANAATTIASAGTAYIATPFTTTYDGSHYLGIVSAPVGAGAVVPSMQVQSNAVSSDLNNEAPILCGFSSTGLTTPATLPSPAGALTAQANRCYAYVS